MTKYLIMIYCLLSSCILQINAQQTNDSVCISSDELLIEPLFDSYHTNDSIYLVVKNISDRPVFCAVGIEENVGRQWIPIVNDVYKHNNDRHRARNIKTLSEGQQSIYVFLVSELLKEASIPQGLCRFSINAKETPLDKKALRYIPQVLLYCLKTIGNLIGIISA